MQQLYIRKLEIGQGRPKICVPIMGKTAEHILEETKKAMTLPADLVEWRGDWYQDIFDREKCGELLKEMRKILLDQPLLFTYRSLQEGGEQAITPKQYRELNRFMCQTGRIDALDVELFMGEAFIKPVIETAHENNIIVIASNHDFVQTPDKDEIIRRLILMDEAEADILKIALMPNSRSDVLQLLEATEEMGRLYTDKPLITISMGPLGLISRLSGESFGSAITFGSGTEASAPGQMPVEQLKKVLEWIHENMS